VNDLSRLSSDQREIYEKLEQGMSPVSIANSMDRPLGIINAQITRMRTKGIQLPRESAAARSALTHHPEDLTRREKPLASNLTSNEDIAAELKGKALSQDELLKELASKIGGVAANDAHPMIVLGCTIQFMKMCGGRMHAHQVIEDVYAAMKALAQGSDKPLPGESGSTAIPGSDREELMERQIVELRQKLEKLEQREQREPTSSYGGSRGW
jgi:hypothetical protein